MNKTVKSVNKWRKNQQLSAGDNRRLDDLIMNIKAGVVTAAIILLFILLLRGCGIL